METNWQPGSVPAPDATYIQIDIDPLELGRGVPARIGVVGDARTILQQLADELGPGEGDRSRIAEIGAAVAELDAEAEAMTASMDRPIHPVRVIRAAREVFPRDTTLGVDVGVLAQHIGGAFPYFRVFGPRTTIVPSSFYGMGFVTAAMPVAKLARPDSPALCFTGDGSFQMVSTVLPVATANRLPVTWVVLNDEALGSIRDIQQHVFDGRILDTEFGYQPDFAALAEACGCHGERVDDPDEVEAALERALKANEAGRPAVLDMRVARVRLAQTREHYVNTYPQQQDAS
jgi:acetolactate synthase I/II/III large subunit